MNNFNKQLIFICLCAIISSAATWATIRYALPQGHPGAYEASTIHQVNFAPFASGRSNSVSLSSFSVPSNNFVYAAGRSTPAVVFIESVSEEQGGLFVMPNSGISTGSGVIISPDGYIVTNNHVVEQAEKIQVLLNDNREYEAELIGTDPTTDLALIKIEDAGLPYLQFGNSDSSQIGEWVLAVGNPLRLQSTVTAGIISAKARNINILNNQQYRIESFIQTDAAVNPGNSGGALVNLQGDLIGINTAIMSQTGRYEGYSFSIPSNLVQKVIMDIKEFGSVQRGLLGVVIEEVNNERANIYGLKQVEGVFISNTTKSGAADEAGLRPEDIILEINNRQVRSVPELQEIIGRMRPGTKIQIRYWRDQKISETEAVLKNQANTTALISTRRDPLLLDLGFEVRDMTDEERQQSKSEGVKVLSIYQGSIIEKTNMAPNYIILSVNGRKVRNVDELIREIKSASGSILLDGFYERYKGRFPYRFHKE